MALKISRSQRLSMVIGISSCFFLTEISFGLYTHSLALVADAFHYLTDLIGLVVALLALKLSEIDDPPKILAFGWQRAPVLGAFFNGALLFALGISILLQAVERFISLHMRKAGSILLGCTPSGIDLNDLRSDLEKIQGVLSIHEINVWHISQHKSLAVIGVLLTDQQVPGSTKVISMVNECCQKYGIQSVALRQKLHSQELSLAA
ncbi:hypothetical protein KXV22_005433 [Aspergillus fumigatus]|nr:hypothetical protein KXX14_001439 [Aspergillus fumigatus]KAH1394945.1 hypothetical protein KXX49_009718 [Aspergillus fumigatus]KAH1449584.1 hypothetical protein KXX68_003327 [Aspergillus fumigatus]KAH1472840.1 hypothetical protein KXX53_007597 [Aspergillus fumigatus]KAH1556101.1 hypothetical protein KXX37_007837 [Aspergillus fumigatus]